MRAIPTPTVVSVATLTGQITLASLVAQGLAPLASPAFTGIPTAPTAAPATNTTQLATTAFVLANAPSVPVSSVFTRTGAIVATSGDYSVAQITGAAPTASPTFSGTITLGSLSGLLKGTAGVVGTATAGTDYLAPSGSGAGLSGIPTSVVNSDGTLTISPTTGSVVASLALGHANTWSALQTLSASITLAQTAATGTPAPGLLFTGAAHTALTLSTEYNDVNLNLARTVQFATGALTTQRAVLIQAPTYSFVGASTITNAATLAITGTPIAGTNATITNPYALWVQGGNTRLDGSLSLKNSSSPITINLNNTGNAFGFYVEGGGPGVVYVVNGSAVAEMNTNFWGPLTSNTMSLGFAANLWTAIFGSQINAFPSADSITGIILRGHSATQSAVLQSLQGISSTSTARDIGYLDAGFSTSTDASYKGFLRGMAQDFNFGTNATGREGWRVGTNGTAALLGFYGVTPVVQQSGDVATSLVNLGLIASGTYGKCPVAIFDDITDVSNVTTTETTLYSNGIGAARFTANQDKVLAQYGGTFAGAVSSTQELRLYFGPLGTNADTKIFDSGALSVGVGTTSWDLTITIIRETSAVVRVTVSAVTSSTTLAGDAQYTRVTGLTLTANQFVTLTGTAAGVAAASNQITASEGYGQYAPSS